MKKTRSHIKDGHAYFANTGTYNEVKRPVKKKKAKNRKDKNNKQ